MKGMRRLVSWLAVAMGVVASYAPSRAAADQTAKPLAPCVSVRAEVRYGAAGYNHIVVLTNVCERAQMCTVSTDVNPAPTDTMVAPRSSAEVVTFLGSPARVFVPKVSCVPQVRSSC